LQICKQIGDQLCIFTNNNFKTLSLQTTKDTLGNWTLSGVIQNIGTNAVNNVRIMWHLYDSQGNLVGLAQGSLIPANLKSGQTALFNLIEKSKDLKVQPKFYRISFDFPI
jgi:hypothetical protein